MVIFKNVNYGNFLLETKGKRAICYGAGAALAEFIKNNRARLGLLDKIDYIADRDPAKAGRAVRFGLRDVPVIAVDEIAARLDCSRYVFIMCLADAAVLDALRTLDGIPALDGLVCYYGLAALFWGKEIFVPATAGKTALPVCAARYAIPKIIHYIWFGDRRFGEVEQECLESWREICPDYELRLWNEANYDLAGTPLYVRQAYEAGKYAFVSDYARLDIVHRHGGFYLDADVLLLRSLDDFAGYRAVFGYLPYHEITTGLGFGSVAGHEDLRNQMKLYESIHFIDGDGELNMAAGPEYATDYFRQRGHDIDNRLRLTDGALFLPSDYLCSLMPVLCGNGLWHLPLYELTENSYAVHRCASTWFEEGMFAAFDDAKTRLAGINSRLLSDWKGSVL